jgi:hypothetical protein
MADLALQLVGIVVLVVGIGLAVSFFKRYLSEGGLEERVATKGKKAAATRARAPQSAESPAPGLPSNEGYGKPGGNTYAWAKALVNAGLAVGSIVLLFYVRGAMGIQHGLKTGWYISGNSGVWYQIICVAAALMFAGTCAAEIRKIVVARRRAPVMRQR